MRDAIARASAENRRKGEDMLYIVKWRPAEEAESVSQTCVSEVEAERAAFGVIGRGLAHIVWIEDDQGNVIGDAEIRRRRGERSEAFQA